MDQLSTNYDTTNVEGNTAINNRQTVQRLKDLKDASDWDNLYTEMIKVDALDTLIPGPTRSVDDGISMDYLRRVAYNKHFLISDKTKVKKGEWQALKDAVDGFQISDEHKNDYKTTLRNTCPEGEMARYTIVYGKDKFVDLNSANEYYEKPDASKVPYMPCVVLGSDGKTNYPGYVKNETTNSDKSITCTLGKTIYSANNANEKSRIGVILPHKACSTKYAVNDNSSSKWLPDNPKSAVCQSSIKHTEDGVPQNPSYFGRLVDGFDKDGQRSCINPTITVDGYGSQYNFGFLSKDGSRANLQANNMNFSKNESTRFRNLETNNACHGNGYVACNTSNPTGSTSKYDYMIYNNSDNDSKDDDWDDVAFMNKYYQGWCNLNNGKMDCNSVLNSGAYNLDFTPIDSKNSVYAMAYGDKFCRQDTGDKDYLKCDQSKVENKKEMWKMKQW